MAARQPWVVRPKGRRRLAASFCYPAVEGAEGGVGSRAGEAAVSGSRPRLPNQRPGNLGTFHCLRSFTKQIVPTTRADNWGLGRRVGRPGSLAAGWLGSVTGSPAGPGRLGERCLGAPGAALGARSPRVQAREEVGPGLAPWVLGGQGAGVRQQRAPGREGVPWKSGARLPAPSSRFPSICRDPHATGWWVVTLPPFLVCT